MMQMSNSRRSEWCILLAGVADYIDENMLQTQDTEWVKTAKTIRTLCNKQVDRLLDGIDNDRARGILNQSKCKRIVIQTTAARMPDMVNMRVLGFDEINALMNFDFYECIVCKLPKADRKKCPKLKLLRQIDLDINDKLCSLSEI